ncbi:hypothetical protein PQR02_05325 [Paraburkholderia sediminicola]|uniref:Uncharacterized protein n=1 Tax=Paraburkholderia rhynchosiae TaxID=487049 RepID=A0ACC7N777_9BURK
MANIAPVEKHRRKKSNRRIGGNLEQEVPHRINTGLVRTPILFNYFASVFSAQSEKGYDFRLSNFRLKQPWSL